MSADFAPDQADFHLGDPHSAYRRLRSIDPVHWYEGSGGAWCVLKHADIMEVSRDPRRFSSTRGIQIGLRPQDTRPEEAPPTILEMDPPEHNRHRKLVIQAFTPSASARLEPMLRQITRECLDAIEPGSVVDLVEALSVPVPMYAIAEMLGVSRERRADFKRWSDAMIEAGGGGRNPVTDAAVGEMFAFFHGVLEERRSVPRQDLISMLAQGAVEGEGLADPEILIFCVTLLAAGNETTRNLISGGALLLTRHPDQLRMLAREPALIANAVEEMLRWWTPVQSFIRTATQDCELRGRRVQAGQQVLLLYPSANRDEEVWGDDPDRFDVTRDHVRARHLAFGFGEHLCLGAPLARLEARVVFEELLARFPKLELAGEVEMLHSRLMHGVERLPLTLGGA